jgi:hypothetical protein
MTSNQEFVLKLLAVGKEYFQMLLPILMAWLVPSPLGKKDKP